MRKADLVDSATLNSRTQPQLRRLCNSTARCSTEEQFVWTSHKTTEVVAAVVVAVAEEAASAVAVVETVVVEVVVVALAVIVAVAAEEVASTHQGAVPSKPSREPRLCSE